MESPRNAKNFTAKGTLGNIVRALAPDWSGRAGATTPDGQKTLSVLLSLVSSICVYPPESMDILPDLNKDLLTAFGALCATNPELRREYPDLAGISTTAFLQGKAILDLCQLARENDVDLSPCDKTEIVHTLVASGKALAPAMAESTVESVEDDPTDRAALMALFSATNGESWENNEGWGTTSSIGEWHGVTVNNDGRVIDLDLRENRLEGK